MTPCVIQEIRVVKVEFFCFINEGLVYTLNFLSLNSFTKTALTACEILCIFKNDKDLLNIIKG